MTMFRTLSSIPASDARRHIANAEERAVHLDGVESVSADDVRTVGIVGAGTMGIGIAIALADSGRTVQLTDRSGDAVQRADNLFDQHYARQMERGRITQDEARERRSRLHAGTDPDVIAPADVVIEAVFEDYHVKTAVLQDINDRVRPDAIIATNTSALDTNRLAQCVSLPERFLGLHFFSPAQIMKLVEVVRGDLTSPGTLARSFALACSMGKLPVLAGVCDGFIGNRMYARYNAAANDLINMGASPQQVDAALEAFGFAMGIFKVGDLAGLELSWAGRKRRAKENPDVDYSVFADRLCEAGRYGQKTLAGWYRYEEGSRQAIPDPVVDDMIRQWRLDRGFITREFTDDEIVERCLVALATEGRRLLDESIAQRMSDIDVVYVNGYGFPRDRGGPMFLADRVGWEVVDQRLNEIAQTTTLDPAFWLPAGNA